MPIPLQRQAGKGSQSQKGAIAAPERHYLQNCKQASLLTKTSWGSGRSTSTWEGAPVVHPENQAAGTGESISRSDHARQTPHHFSCSDLGRAQNAGPTESAPLRTTWVPEPERLRPGRCMQPRASLWWFPVEQPRSWAVWAGRVQGPWERAGPVWLEALRAHASVICLQRPSLPTAWLKKWA